jgi:hypothetical protein
MIPLTDKRLLLQVLYPRWGGAAGPLKDGYSILLPMPSDLPVFYKIAMRVLSRQKLGNANDVIIIPDNPRPAFRDMVDQDRSGQTTRPVILEESTGLKRAVARLYNRPNHYHWSQIVRGVRRSGSRYALLHDADMFLLEEDFLEDHYAAALQRNLKVLGISPAWDPWFAQNGLDHVTATWEMLASVEWFRSFPPILFHGHTNRLGGRTHTFDTTYYIQCLTPPPSIARRECGSAFIHFNWLISGYRWFLKHLKGYCDDRFIIMLLRLLIDEFDSERGYTLVPSWEEIAGRISDVRGSRFYPPIESHGGTYRMMRAKIGDLFRSPLVTRAGRDSIDRKLEAFDRHYGFVPPGEKGS